MFREVYVLGGFLTGGLIVRWLLSGSFSPEAFDLEPIKKAASLLKLSEIHKNRTVETTVNCVNGHMSVKNKTEHTFNAIY